MTFIKKFYHNLQDEIEAFEDNQKKTQFRNNLFQKCGVVLDDEGLVAADKAVQVEQLGNKYCINSDNVGL